jgi:hypothetical protein
MERYSALTATGSKNEEEERGVSSLEVNTGSSTSDADRLLIPSRSESSSSFILGSPLDCSWGGGVVVG